MRWRWRKLISITCSCQVTSLLHSDPWTPWTFIKVVAVLESIRHLKRQNVSRTVCGFCSHSGSSGLTAVLTFWSLEDKDNQNAGWYTKNKVEATKYSHLNSHSNLHVKVSIILHIYWIYSAYFTHTLLGKDWWGKMSTGVGNRWTHRETQAHINTNLLSFALVLTLWLGVPPRLM